MKGCAERYALQLYQTSLSTYVTFSEKLRFLTPSYAPLPVRIRGLEMFVFRKILHTYLMDRPIVS